MNEEKSSVGIYWEKISYIYMIEEAESKYRGNRHCV